MFLKENSPETTKKSKKSKKMEKPEKCPLCCETMDLDDLSFQPCPCGYKVCLFCWHIIKSNGNDSKCPLCRRIYADLPAKFEPPTAEQIQKIKNKKKQEDVKKKQKLAEDRKQLADVRVVRKNLIFVNELPLNFNKDAKSFQRFVNIFKQAGQVKKTTVLNSSKNYAGQKAPYARAYITYQKNEEALKALKLLENVEFEGRELKICLGTTKYCSNFIKNVKCTNKECVYLHEQAEAEASFTKEQIHIGKHIEYGQKLYNQYIQSVNNMHTKSIANQIAEDKKLDLQSQLTEESEKEVITDNSIPSSQQSIPQNQEEKSSSPTSSEDAKLSSVHEGIMKAFSKDPSSMFKIPRNQLSPEQLAALKALFSFDLDCSVPPNSSADCVNKGAKQEPEEPPFEERFVAKRESAIPNGNLFHEGNPPVSIQDSLLSRLIKPHSPNESRDNLRTSFRNEIGSHNHLNGVLQDSRDFNLESRDDCGLDFDPVQMALGGLGELVVSEKQKARIEVNSLNSTLINAFKKQTNQQQQQPRAQQQQPIYSPPNSILQSNPYQNRSQGSPVIEYCNQSPYNRPNVQCSTPVARTPVQSQPSQRFTNLSIQLPRMSVGNSVANGYSPQPFMPQVSPQESFMMSQQQSQNFENYPQHFPNFEQITPPQVFSVNNLQNQSVRDPTNNTHREYFGGNMPVGQRLRNESLIRHQQFQQQQSYQQPQLQRFPSFGNSTPQGDSRPNGNNTFP